MRVLPASTKARKRRMPRASAAVSSASSMRVPRPRFCQPSWITKAISAVSGWSVGS